MLEYSLPYHLKLIKSERVLGMLHYTSSQVGQQIQTEVFIQFSSLHEISLYFEFFYVS